MAFTPGNKIIAVLDACVLYPAALRDLLMWLGLRRLYGPRFTDAIHEEWIRNVLANTPSLSLARLTHTRELMNRVDPAALVCGYEAITSTLQLPDPDDRHVLAAAIHSGASVIVTFNLRDFPKKTLIPLGVRPLHHDVFLTQRFGDAPAEAVIAVNKMRANLKNPPQRAEELVEHFRAIGLPRFAQRLTPHQTSI